MTESELLSQVTTLAKKCGWLVYHVPDSRRCQAGFPDLVLVGDRVVFMELKTDKGTLSKDQEKWLRAIRKAGSEAYVVRDIVTAGNVLAKRLC